MEFESPEGHAFERVPNQTGCARCGYYRGQHATRRAPADAKKIHPMAENGIAAFIHCGLCIETKPTNVSPREWAQLEVGWTKEGLQVWCRRHEANVMHIHFEKVKHPAYSSLR